MKRTLIMPLPWFALALATVASLLCGCGGPYNGVSYDRYMELKREPSFDPVGATDIYEASSQGRDGYEMWWRMNVTESQFTAIVADAAGKNSGPRSPTPAETSGYPAKWKADSDSPPPSWWRYEPHRHAVCYHWCHGAGGAGRHHGWYFGFERQTKTMFVWHWNHQHATDECY